MDGVRTKKGNASSQSTRGASYRFFSHQHVGKDSFSAPRYRVYQLGKPYDVHVEDRAVHRAPEVAKDGGEDSAISKDAFFENAASFQPEKLPDLVHHTHDNTFFEKEGSYQGAHFNWRDIPVFVHDSVLHPHHISFRYALAVAAVFLVVGSVIFVGTAYAVKGRVDHAAQQAVLSIKSAIGSIAQNDYSSSSEELDRAYKDFTFASAEMGKINIVAKYISQFIPGASRLASGDHIIEAGKYITHTAKELHSIIPEVIDDDHKLISSDGKHVSLLSFYQLLADRMDIARYDLAEAQNHIDQVHVDDVPEEYRDTFVTMKEILPEINTSLRTVTESRPIIEDMLGANGPRTYLLLFENNHEMRATGGFIGSYGIVRVNKGRISDMTVNDVYDADGQLIDRIVPPLPIQKISANWSLHDSNWFADFPVSARKAMDFYERTGGSSVDGVIAITPEMLRKFLDITGPIDVNEHDVTLTSENFMQILQSEVEDVNNYVATDKTSEVVTGAEHQGDDMQKDDNTKLPKKNDEKDDHIKTEKMQSPKKILADLMPIMVDKLFDKKNLTHLSDVAHAVSLGLQERHIVLYMKNADAQKIIENNEWGGVVAATDKDYLSVIDTNINGFKTDGVITETISHEASITADGDIIDTVRIKRQHNGGHTGYPWWDAVNANYMRIYVPQGSELISVEGQTREINGERISYDALGYQRDRDVEEEEKNMRIDEETGTRIYEQSGKTVFANWVYVSPQESVTVTYVYRLPFSVQFDEDHEGKFGSYAVLFQKQAGSANASIESTIDLDGGYDVVWHAHDKDDLSMDGALVKDRYNGVVFRAK